jgi:hypothetical protein
MSPVLWLRAAACVTALLAVGHLLGQPWAPVTNAEGQHILDAMRSYHFDAMGFHRSYEDFYEGFGWMIGIYLLAHAVLFWQLAYLTRIGSTKLRPLVAILCLEYVFICILSAKFLFWIPLVMSAAIAAVLLQSWISLGIARPAMSAGVAPETDHPSM